MATPEELLGLLLDQNKDHAVILLDPTGSVLGWLAGAESVFGYSAEEMIGRPVSAIFTPEDRERGADQHELEVARNNGRAEDDRWQVRKDGTRIWASGVLIPLRDPAGAVVGFGKVLRDRTDVKAQIDALANSAERHRANLGTLAHELRAPLAPIANSLELIRHTPAAGSIAAPLERIERQTAHMRRLVDDMMEATRVGAGKVKLQLQTVQLEDVLNRAAEACRPQAEKRRQEFKVLLLPAPTVLDADPDRVYQVVVNLLTNAIKYTPEGGGVWLKATVEGSDAVVRVEDNGCGIAPDVLPRIFDLFTQEPESVDRSEGGLGLGLSVVKALVALHGGTVQVRSEGRGKGSEFTVRFPMPRV